MHHFLLLFLQIVQGSDGPAPAPSVILTSTNGGGGLVRATRPSDHADPRPVPRPPRGPRRPRRRRS